MTGFYVDKFRRQGVDPDEAKLLDRAMMLARSTLDYRTTLDYSSLRTVRGALGFAATVEGVARADYRDHHQLLVRNLTAVSAAELAFGDVSDSVREQNSAFCYLMHRGHQQRFIDRNPEETPQEFIDRPRKATLNVTALVIGILSKLYADPPVRETAGTTSEKDAAALEQIWDPLFNRTMLEADRLTRLVGTVAIRPIYDEKVPGRIRPWLFLSHQLRIVPNEQEPWRVAAVVERQKPFDPRTPIRIWTDKSVVTIDGTEGRYEPHAIGRIPHVWIHDQLSYTSFFTEGRGHALCDPNAILNNDLTDLEEVKQLQGFATLEVTNPVEDLIRVGPRQVWVFRPKTPDEPFGLRYVSPNAPIRELRRDIEAQLRDILRVNGVPEAAVGLELGRQATSGIAIRNSMRPIEDDLKERRRIFVPVENDWADAALRVRSEQDPNYAYDPQNPPEVLIRYAPLAIPLSTTERVKQDQFDVATGASTPARIMRRDDPETHASQKEAVAAWRQNLDEMEQAGFEPTLGQPELQADFSVDAAADAVDDEAAPQPDDHTPLLNALEGVDLEAVLRESEQDLADTLER